MAEYPQDITQRFHGTAEQMAAALVGDRPKRWDSIVIEDYDPAWPDRYAAISAELRQVLGELVLSTEHVGSTSVPGLAAKSIIDVDLLIEDTADEAGYLPALERIGYRLVLREPWWHGHRMLVSAAEDVHLHVWPNGASEPVRHRLFRDWLRSHPADRELYAATKQRLARDTTDRPGDYNLAKNAVIDEIYARIFAPGIRLFSYGTLQQPGLQETLFGRRVAGRPDRLPGYRLEMLTITDPDVVAASGRAEHPIARWTGDPGDHIDGTALTLTGDELAAADTYEVDDYTRALVPLASGDPAWVYAATHAVT